MSTKESFLVRHRWSVAAAALACFVIAGRLAIIAHYGTDLPIWDQWAAETNAFVMPLGDGSFGLKKLFLPTNEHRICFTLLTNGALTAWSGQWDARQQAVVNALFYGLLLAWLWSALARSFPGRWAALLFVVVAGAGGLPIVFENILWGFQSQFFFMAGFSLYGIFQLLGAAPGSWRWHTGWLAGGCAMLSLGSGFLAPLVVLAIIVARALLNAPGVFRKDRATLVAAVLLLAFAWFVHAPAPPQNVALHAANVRQFLTYLLSGMAWPATDRFWLGSLVYLPGIVLAWRWCRTPAWRDPRATFVIAGLGWALLQTAALAYARSNTTMWPPANRYGDLYLYGLLFNTAAALLLVERSSTVRPRWGAAVLLAVPLAVFLVGSFRATHFAVREKLPATRSEFRMFEKTISRYLATRDPQTLDQGAYPYPVREVMIFMLEQPAIRSRLPASVSPAPPENPAAIQPSRLSRLASALSDRWAVVFLIGVMLGLLAIVLPRRPSTLAPSASSSR